MKGYQNSRLVDALNTFVHAYMSGAIVHRMSAFVYLNGHKFITFVVFQLMQCRPVQSAKGESFEALMLTVKQI